MHPSKDTEEQTLREKVEAVLYSTPIEIFVYMMIIASVAFIGIEVSFPETYAAGKSFFEAAEYAFITFFSIEYVLKFAVAKDKWLFFRLYFLDLLSILPFLRFFRLFRGFRILRLLRVVRLLRLGNMVARRLAALDGVGNAREVIIILVVFLCTVLAGSIGMLMFEGDPGNPDAQFKNLSDGLWWCLVTLTTVGYGDKYPVTGEGRILGAIIMLVGLSFYGLVAGLGSTFIIARLKKGSQWMISTFTNHTVVLGVNDKLDRVVSLLLEQNQRVIVVTEDVDRVTQYPEHLVGILEGDFLDEKILAKAKVGQAVNAIILNDPTGRTSKDADARSVLAALAVERQRPEITTVVEAVHPATVAQLRAAGVDDVIESGALTAEMLAYSTDHPGYSEHLGILLRFVHQNRIIEDPVPERFVGRQLYDVQKFLAAEQKVLLAASIDGEETLDPGLTLSADHSLVCIEII